MIKIGDNFGEYTVVKRAVLKQRWICECSCSNKKWNVREEKLINLESSCCPDCKKVENICA